MGLQINTNELAIAAQRNLENTQKRLSTTVQRLASGSKIVQASDDPAGLAISDRLNATIRSLGAAVKNAQDGVSLIQIYEGGTTEINNMAVRIRELLMQSSTDTVGDRERSMINNEVVQLKEEVDRVARSTKYNGRELLSGEVIQMEFQVGTENNPEVDRIKFAPGDTNMTLSALGMGDVDASNKEAAQNSLSKVDEALNRVNDIRARVGSAQNRLQTTISAQSIFQENLLAAKSRIKDADLAVESSNLAKETILRKAGVAVLTQANETPALALQLLR